MSYYPVTKRRNKVKKRRLHKRRILELSLSIIHFSLPHIPIRILSLRFSEKKYGKNKTFKAKLVLLFIFNFSLTTSTTPGRVIYLFKPIGIVLEGVKRAASAVFFESFAIVVSLSY